MLRGIEGERVSALPSGWYFPLSSQQLRLTGGVGVEGDRGRGVSALPSGWYFPLSSQQLRGMMLIVSSDLAAVRLSSIKQIIRQVRSLVGPGTDST